MQPSAASAITVSGAEVNARPFSRVGEALEVVPGLIVTQHSGEGKANQYFLRGFNLDHGTDLAISVDGMPVNMPTTATGKAMPISIL
jgi:outer membrane cobalamin receptor